MDNEMRQVRRKLLCELRKEFPRLSPHRLVVMKNRDGSFTSWINDGARGRPKRRTP